MQRKILVLALFFFEISHGFSQELYTNASMRRAYLRQTRSESGRPGKYYWQNRADYQIHVAFDPKTHLLSGREAIDYWNESPDTLHQLVIRLYPDHYKKGVARLDKINPKDLNNGVVIDSFVVGNEYFTNFQDLSRAYHQNTNLFIKPLKGILPGSKTTLMVQWHYSVNTGSPVRTGMVDTGSYFLAYFFPRISVYDDIDGWDTWSYNGIQEFYNDFGNFHVYITVPKNYVVWATGDQVDPSLNLSKVVMDRLQKAKSSNEIIRVIDSGDYRDHRVFSPENPGVWEFKANDVTDFAFAVSDHYLSEASSILVDSAKGRRTLATAAFNPSHRDYYDVARQAHQSVYLMCHVYPKYPFPFDNITVFDGTDQMEYPMMVNDNPTRTPKDAVQLTSHEIFHSYFPFFMGTDETQNAWMDEGWASIGESVISPLMGYPEDDGIFEKSLYEQISGTDKDVPLITSTKIYSGPAYYSNSYGKGALCYYVLQDLLGDARFFRALHYYMDTWHGKHPSPYDFFYSINHGSGTNLDWFWNKWFFGWAYPDLAIRRVEAKRSGTEITVENVGGLPVPVCLTIHTRGTKIVLKSTASVWKNGDNIREFTSKIPMTRISRITLGNDYIPDKDRTNNDWVPSRAKL